MSLWSKGWSGLSNVFTRTASRKNRKPAGSHAGRPRTRRLALERLETRELLAADPAIGINIERIVDWSPAWTFTDAFKTSRVSPMERSSRRGR